MTKRRNQNKDTQDHDWQAPYIRSNQRFRIGILIEQLTNEKLNTKAAIVRNEVVAGLKLLHQLLDR